MIQLNERVLAIKQRRIVESFRDNLYRIIKHLSESKHLTEKFDFNAIFDSGEFAQAKRKWDPIVATGKKGQDQLFAAAKNRDKTAQNFLFQQMRGQIMSTFWKNYMGPQKKKRSMSNDEAAYTWISSSFEQIFGNGRTHFGSSAIDTFDPEKVKGDDLIGAFAGLVNRKLQSGAAEENLEELGGGTGDRNLKGATRQFGTDSEGKDEMASVEDQYNTFDEVDKKVTSDQFLANWKKLAQDPLMDEKIPKTGGKGSISFRDVAFELINNPKANQDQISKKFGVHPGKVKQQVETFTGLLIPRYKIEGEDLKQAFNTMGSDKVASYLSGGVATDFNQQKPPEPNEDDESPAPREDDDQTQASIEKEVVENDLENDPFVEKFKEFCTNDKLWVPHVGGLDRANALVYQMYSDFSTDVDQLSKTWGFQQSQWKYFYPAAIKLLGKYNIAEAEFKEQVGRIGKDKIKELLGQPDPEYDQSKVKDKQPAKQAKEPEEKGPRKRRTKAEMDKAAAEGKQKLKRQLK